MNFAPMAIAVERVIAMHEMQMLQERARDWSERYGIAAGPLLAAAACQYAANFKARVDGCRRKYGDIEL